MRLGISAFSHFLEINNAHHPIMVSNVEHSIYDPTRVRLRESICSQDRHKSLVDNRFERLEFY